MYTDLHRIKKAGIRAHLCVSVANFWFCKPVLCAIFSVSLSLGLTGNLSADDRVTLPDGFELTQVATDELATNIFCMIALPDGSALVSGPGYISQLIDEDQDGIFDRAELVSDFLKSGAQGLAVDGDDLLCVGDGGIWRLPDAMNVDKKQVETKPPVRLFEISTRGEHHAHSIQKGPDGWWYHIAGNESVFDSDNCTGPVRKRRAGVVMRFSPDFSERQIMAHGFRNAYDFAFNSTDQLFTFDSDGERDLGLPWYRPTRVFEIVPGDDAGWVSKTWKRPSYYFDMPRLIGDAGRASPTGVVCYDGAQFPIEYDDAIFLGDWTFGRVLVCRRKWKTGEYLPPEDFLIPKDSFGFPVTDLAVANDGSLLVSVGGRGTEGGVWRVTSTMKRKETEESLGKYIWDPRRAFHQDLAIKDAIERASKALEKNEPSAQVDALALLLVHSQSLTVDRFGPDVSAVLYKASRSNDPKVVAATYRLVEALCNQNDPWEKLLVLDTNRKMNARLFTLARIVSQPNDLERRALFDFLLSAETFGNDFERKNSFPDDISSRLAQLLFKGVGQSDSYFSSVIANEQIERADDQVKPTQGLIFNAIEQAKSDTASLELARLMAMENVSAVLAGRYFLSQIDSHQEQEISTDLDLTYNGEVVGLGWLRRPTASTDLHWLMCFVQLEPTEDEEFVKRLANILLHIQKKFRKQKVKTDSHFRPMLDELGSRALKKYPVLARRFLTDKNFGTASHGYLFSGFPDDEWPLLQKKLADWVLLNPDDATSDHVAVLARNPTEFTVDALRKLAAKRSLKNEVTLALTKSRDANDQPLFVEGLQSLDPRVQKQSAIALRKLTPEVSVDVAAAALQAAMRLGNEKQDVSIRDQLILLLRKFAGRDFGYQLKRPDLRQSNVLLQWRAFLIDQQPELADVLKPTETGQQQMARLKKLDWDSGEAEKGGMVFQKLQCASCHGTGRAFGPRLEGVTQRLGRNDLLTAIVNPDAQVSDRYRTTLFETADGLFLSGSIIYENVDGVTIRESNGQTVRLNRDQIEAQRRSGKSIMPTGLLDQVTDQEVVDLMAYLKTL